MNILYLTGGCFPHGSAYASRTLNLCKAMNKAGNLVYVIADYGETSCEADGMVDGIGYHLIDNQKELSYSKRLNKYIEYVSKHIASNKPELVVCASDHDRFIELSKIIRKHHIPLVLESCEWFGYHNWNLGFINPRYYKFLECWHKHFPKVDGVIAISSLLKEHYLKTVNNVICVPTVLDLTFEKCCFNTNNAPIKLVYAGSAGKSKDLLKNLILAMERINKNNIRFTVDIYGVNEILVKKQLGSKKSVLKRTQEYVKIHGRVSQKYINSIYCEKDYSVILRPARRSSNAGFPTKLAESMAAGTPVICNDTGDIGIYVKEDINGFFVKDTKIKSIYNCLERLENRENQKACETRKTARQTAEENFCYLSYIVQLKNFLDKVVKDFR